MFCPECGADHHAAERAEREEAERAADREVEIERLRTKRDIEVARIQASAAKDIAEEEADADLARAEGRAEGMTEVIEAAAPESAPEPPEDEGPVVVMDDAEVAEEPDDGAPPIREESGEPKESRKRVGLGMW